MYRGNLDAMHRFLSRAARLFSTKRSEAPTVEGSLYSRVGDSSTIDDTGADANARVKVHANADYGKAVNDLRQVFGTSPAF